MDSPATEQAANRSSETSEIYSDFDAFLKATIHEYYRTSGKKNRANFIALVIASGEIASLAADTVRSGEGMRKLALGAAGVVALRFGLKYALSGPLGLLLAAGTAASLVGYFIRNRAEIASRIGRYRELVAQLRIEYEGIQSDQRDGRLSGDQRDLMLDGLQKRFLADIDR